MLGLPPQLCASATAKLAHPPMRAEGSGTKRFGEHKAHNHPSGAAEPSRADEYLTQTLKTALQLVDVRVLDHLVVTANVVVSFAERGLL